MTDVVFGSIIIGGWIAVGCVAYWYHERDNP
jgi:hypothetical protein